MAKKINLNHKIGKKWTGFTLFSAIVWGFFSQLVLVNIPFLSQSDVKIIDFLMRLKSSPNVIDEVVLVKIQEKDLRKWGVIDEPQNYANIARNLLDSDAKVVVLNILPNWLKLAEQNDNYLKKLVTNYADRIVLVTRVTSFSLNKLPELSKYNQLFTFDSDTNLLANPQEIQAFFEYDSAIDNDVHLNHPARLFHLRSEFILADNFNQIETFDSVALLTLKKYQQTQAIEEKNRSIYVNFYQHNFVTLEIDDLEQHLKSKYFQDKIVILGFSDPDNPDSLAMLSPFGEKTPAIELQAHQIASLLTDSYHFIFPLPVQLTVIISTIFFLNYLIILTALRTNYSYQKKIVFCLFLLLIFFVLATLISFSFNIIIPYSVFILAWLLTCFSTLLTIKFSSQQILLKEQEYELMRLQSSEQEAVLTQAQKVINRLASDLHDGPLQELKVVMDDLEILEMQDETLPLSSPLNKLERLGIDIRKILAEKDHLSLKITPELKQGLDYAIANKIEQLSTSAELNLEVILNLEQLQEPSISSVWFANREDIFLFFCEAINNVIKHAQPPFGKATYVEVNLSQQETQCRLEIINDGYVVNSQIQQRQRGGYGTKLMETIASDLPQGDWHRTIESDRVCVSLHWQMISAR